MVQGIFEGISSAITNFVQTLNNGITAMIGLFWSNNALTLLGVLTTIVVGVSITYFLFRMVMGLIRLRG